MDVGKLVQGCCQWFAMIADDDFKNHVCLAGMSPGRQLPLHVNGHFPKRIALEPLVLVDTKKLAISNE